jgi:hypothetical protein
MLRLFFFLLLIACLGLGAYAYVRETQPHSDVPAVANSEALKVVTIVDPVKAKQETQTTRKLVESLSSAACLEFRVKPADAVRAQGAFAQLQLGERLTSKNIEEFSRFGVSMPAQKDRKAAEALVANLKKAGLKEMIILSDNSISLGVLSTEESAKRLLSELLVKAPTVVKPAAIVPRSPQVKETIFTVREPEINVVARLTVMQRNEYESSTVKAIPCPVAPPAASVADPAKAGKT